jgi:hypothetical protein
MKALGRIAVHLSLILVLSPMATLAHGGKLDSLGCHHDRKRGGYHCHRGPLAGQGFASKAEALNALEEKQGTTPTQQGQTQTGQRPSKAEPRTGTDDENRTVYVTRTGKKYHGTNCCYLSRGRTPISLKEARKQGYTPCSRCGGR